MDFFAPTVPIPVDTWRLGVFALPRSVMHGLTEHQIEHGLIYRLTRGGFNISAASIRPLEIWVNLFGEPAQCWGAWVQNTMQKLTTAQFIQRMNLPAQFSVETSPDYIDDYLGTFQGTFAADVYLARPVVMGTSETQLSPGVWYAASAVWLEGDVPAAAVLESRLRENGMELFSAGKTLIPFFYDDGSGDQSREKGLTFLFFTGNQQLKVKQVSEAIGADLIAVNVAAPYDEPGWTALDDQANLGHELLGAGAELGQSLGKVTSGILEGTSTVLDVVGFVGKYLVPLALLFGGVYFVYRIRKKNKWSTDYWPPQE